MTLTQLFSLYDFDERLRVLLFALIQNIELELRTKIAYHLALTCDSEGYRDISNFTAKADKKSGIPFHDTILQRLGQQIEHQKTFPSLRIILTNTAAISQSG